MALFNFGKKKEEEKKTPACACSCGCTASEAESITNDCCPDLKEGEICCIKVLGAGCKSCHEQFEYTKQAVKDMGLSVEVEYITDMQKVMEYGVMSMPALVVNDRAFDDNWGLPDPTGKSDECFIQVIERISQKIKDLKLEK